MRKHKPFFYFINNISTVIAIVLVWRGIWYVLDEIDAYFFGGSHLALSIFGIILGILILYIPDKDLKEIEKL